MSRASALLNTLQSQAIVLRNLLTGRPITTPSLGSMTLDPDDVDVARQYLKGKASWTDTKLVSQFEREFAEWNGSDFAFAFMGGRVALSAIIYALGLHAGDEVILPGYTCVVVPNAFLFAGIKPLYSDIELDTYGLDVQQLERHITSRTRAILLHHLYGLVCRDYEAILDFARRHGLWVIEDCAHATGALFQGQKIGNRGDVAFFSSEQSKVFNTIQGGLATTNDASLATKLRQYYDQAPEPDTELISRQLQTLIRNFYLYKHSRRWLLGNLVDLRYVNSLIKTTTDEEINGICPKHYGQKMPSPIAAIGLNQLYKLDRYNERRRSTCKMWDLWCEANGYKKPMVLPDSTPVYLRYPVLVEEKKKKDLSWAVNELKVNPGVWYISNIHPADRIVDDCPNADRAVKECINFPSLL